jgi:hypothetical protein
MITYQSERMVTWRAAEKAFEIEVTVDDARRCNRLRGGSVRDCACRLGDRWEKCPPPAHLAVLDTGVMRDVLTMLQSQPALPASQKRTATPILTGEMCREDGCGGFLVRTGSCMTCQACGANEGCG